MKIHDWNKFNEMRGFNFKTEKETDWIASMRAKLQIIVDAVGESKFTIQNDNFYDEYEGPHAEVLVDRTPYEIWTAGDNLWIKDFPLDNTSEKGREAGFEGSPEEIIDLISGEATSYPSGTLN